MIPDESPPCNQSNNTLSLDTPPADQQEPSGRSCVLPGLSELLVCWPDDQVLTIALRFADARQRAHAAAVAGDAEAKRLAGWEADGALIEYERLKWQLAEMWLAGLRASLDVHPEAVCAALGGTNR